MGSVIHSMGVSADGYVTDANGSIDWTAPSDELHSFHNDRVREQGAQLLGRRLYETMLVWETDPSLSEDDIGRDFAAIWTALPKVVFSRTLDRVEGSNTRLADSDLATEVAAMRERVDGDIGIGGADLAGQAAALGLIDEYWLFVAPIALGGGTPFFPAEQRLSLELVETRTFEGGVVHLRYRQM